MTTKRSKETDRRIKAMNVLKTEPKEMPGRVIEVERSGDWMPADELREAAMIALATGDDTTLSLDGIDHLDASAMQILLALGAEQRDRGQHLHLVNTSAPLRQWFELSGAADQLFPDGRNANE
jgi:anti-anti-sigma regulatory factor